MSGRFLAALVFGFASFVLATAARAETDPARDPGAARIRDAFKVDGIALFDPHMMHAARMGVCAPSVFAGLKWCVSGTAEETKGEASYVKTTGYNIDGAARIVYAISSRRSYPLKRDAFDGVIQAIGERYGASAAVYALRKPQGEGGAVDSLIAVWGSLRLVHLTEAEYAVVESGGSLKRGHLVDHRFNLIASAKQREPIYKIEGGAGFILHLTVTSPDRADVIARVVYPQAFLPPPAKPGAEAGNPLVTDTVRRPSPAVRERDLGDDAPRRIEAERGLAAERLLREEAERKAAEEKAARADAERKWAAERKALEEEKSRAEAERKSAEDRARAAETERKAVEERAKRAERERMSSEERRRAEEAERAARIEAERKAAEDAARRAEAKRAEAERKALEERRRKEEAERAARTEAERKVAEQEKARRAEAERKAAEERSKRAEAERKIAEDRRKAAEEQRAAEQKRAEADAERKAGEEKARRLEAERAAEEGRKEADERADTERKAAAERVARERAARPESWYRLAAEAAKAAGAIWSLSETQDRVAEERTLRTQTIFGGEQLAVEVTFECTIIAGERRLRAVARGFDRKSGTAVAFKADGEGSFGVRTRIRLDEQPPQDGLLFRERRDDMASILEIPLTSADLGTKTPRAAIWLHHYRAAVEFNLVAGTVPATIAPYSDNLRKVLEACAQ